MNEKMRDTPSKCAGTSAFLLRQLSSQCQAPILLRITTGYLRLERKTFTGTAFKLVHTKISLTELVKVYTKISLTELALLMLTIQADDTALVLVTSDG